MKPGLVMFQPLQRWCGWFKARRRCGVAHKDLTRSFGFSDTPNGSLKGPGPGPSKPDRATKPGSFYTPMDLDGQLVEGVAVLSPC